MRAQHTPIELARLAADRLAGTGIENARLDAELLLAHTLGLRRLDLYLQFDRPLSEAEVARYRVAVRRRLRREPVQYIVGETAFRELSLRVDARALIPRPETELLVGEVLRWAGGRALDALDIGTGSGAIALSLVREGGFAHVVATDVSADALALAAENAAAAGLADAVEFRRGALWDAVPNGERFDVIASNPPYVADAERAALAPE
ncbi:MAG: N5-glutamine methyltransferase family protein, partial [Longimicrobiales bacterium]